MMFLSFKLSEGFKPGCEHKQDASYLAGKAHQRDALTGALNGRFVRLMIQQVRTFDGEHPAPLLDALCIFPPRPEPFASTS